VTGGVHVWANCRVERQLGRAGYRFIAGLDEAGRGSWAGPLVAAAVILPGLEIQRAWWLRGVADSKLLSPETRERLAKIILRRALSVGVGVVAPESIDLLGLTAAGHLCFWRALRNLGIAPDYLLIDAFRIPDARVPQRGIIGGDRKCVSIAAASIVAKVARDRMMRGLALQYPDYGLDGHKGYGTPEHQRLLIDVGPSSIHRHSWAPVSALVI